MSETKFCFEVEKYDVAVTKLELVRETPAFVTVKRKHWSFGGPDKFREERCKKDGYRKIFPTFAEAKAYLVKRTEEELESARFELQKAQGDAGNAKGLKEPE